jgi:aminopeptidase
MTFNEAIWKKISFTSSYTMITLTGKKGERRKPFLKERGTKWHFERSNCISMYRSDLYLQRMARVLVHYSLGIKKGERLGVETTPCAMPLVRTMVREAVRAGAHPEVLLQAPGVPEILLSEGTNEQIMYVSMLQQTLHKECEKLLRIIADDQSQSVSGFDPTRLALAQRAHAALNQILIGRTSEGSLHWTLALFPTRADARHAGMSLHEFEGFVSHACFLDEEEPVSRWQELSQQQVRLIGRLQGKHTIRVLGRETDLALSVEGRHWLNDDGHYNFPGGEFFTSPVETSANGCILFSFPAFHKGHTVEDVRLRFEDGLVVEAKAAKGQDYLDKMLALDEGARRLGEFAFGNNPNVDRCTKNVLFDEKMGGTIHLALGAGFPPAGGINRSALHWDMVCDLRSGSEVYVDGELFARDGKFTAE